MLELELKLQLLMVLDCRDKVSCKGAMYGLPVDDDSGGGMVIVLLVWFFALDGKWTPLGASL